MGEPEMSERHRRRSCSSPQETLNMMADPTSESSVKPTLEQVAEQLCVMLNLESHLRSIAIGILSLPKDDRRLTRLAELVCRQVELFEAGDPRACELGQIEIMAQLATLQQ